MTLPLTSTKKIGEFSLWEKMEAARGCLAFTLEVTARCNNNCRHCYINVPAHDTRACQQELDAGQILDIADQAVRLGAVWCTITGGEPLLRPDFSDIYLGLKKKGLLVSVMTNATLLDESHVDLFRRFPPRDIEITVYGVTKATYESVSRCPGSFDAFMRGLHLLENAGIKFRLKAMAIRSNIHEILEIREFCQAHTKDYYRFDPLLHLRIDRNPVRNDEIRLERLSPQEVASLDKSDEERIRALEKNCHEYVNPEFGKITGDLLLSCGAGGSNFAVSPDGMFRLCESLCHPDCVYDLKQGTLVDAWEHFIPSVRAMRSSRKDFLTTCRVCPIINLCMWCPAHADLETGELDGPVDYFCQVAHERARILGYRK